MLSSHWQQPGVWLQELSLIALWKIPYPSEDGEALHQIGVESTEIRPGALELTCSQGWFAVYTTCRHEKRVAQHFTQREIEHYLPLYRSARKWRDGSRVTLDLPLFPGYLFVRMIRSDRRKVLSVPGALAVVGGTGREPLPLPDASIEALRRGLQQRTVEPHALLTVGQRVRIRSGSFAGMDGVVQRKRNGFRVVITLDQIMQSVAVEVDENDVEPAASGAKAPSLWGSKIYGLKGVPSQSIEAVHGY